MLRKVRIVLGALFFIGITLLFLDFTGTAHTYLGWMVRVQFLPAVLALHVAVVVGLIALTLICGRVYCSVICPLGVMQDLIAWFGRKAKRNRYSYSPAKQWLRVGVLALFVASLLAGIGSAVALLAPYSAYGRIAQNLLSPLWRWGNNLLALLAERADSYAFYEADVWLRSLPTFVVAALSLLLLFVLAWRNGRTYCNTICPVGTVLGFVARFAWLKPVIDKQKCVGCKLCAKNCKASCIDTEHHRIDYSRCVGCMDCLEKCHVGAISFKHQRETSVSSSSENTGRSSENTGRRSFLSTSALIASTAFVQAQEKKVDGGLAPIIGKQSVRRTAPVPAGAQSRKHFYQHCTACQLCVAACPNGVLRPSTDLQHLMQPEMGYERGYCRPECTRCSEVCPTGAIRLVDEVRKASTQIGKAVWRRHHCVPFSDGVECGNCARHCPTGAITMVPIDKDDARSLHMPVVNTERCIGCGACENLCPVRPVSAIRVEGHDVHRTI